MKKHIRRIAKLEPEFPQDVLENMEIEKIIESYEELEHNDKTIYESSFKDELQSYNIIANEKYERLGELRTVLDRKRRVHQALSLGRADVIVR